MNKNLLYSFVVAILSLFCLEATAQITVGGPALVCVGNSLSLTHATSGGTWTSGATAVATVNTVTGEVWGVSAGTSTITYAFSGGPATLTVTVLAIPTVPSISGDTVVCVGSAKTLSIGTTGGNWYSSNSAVASVNSVTGIVSGRGYGFATIMYAKGNMCGFNWSYKPMVVYTLSGISGSSSVCESATFGSCNSSGSVGLVIYGSPLGGTWSSSNTSVANISSTSGLSLSGTAYYTSNSFSAGTTGVATISYSHPSGCLATQQVTVNPIPAAITKVGGVDSMCEGGTVTLTTTTTGGYWSASTPCYGGGYDRNSAVGYFYASVNSSTGVVTGNFPDFYDQSVHYPNIMYVSSAGCVRTTTVKVNPIPNLGGTTIVCGSTTVFSSGVSGGTWSSSNTAVMTVGSTSGTVTRVSGVSIGTAVMTYTTRGGCIATQAATLGGLSDTISGPTNVCIGSQITLSNAQTGGNWSSTFPSRATINSSTGVVTGLRSGTAGIVFNFSNSCGSGTRFYNVTVDSLTNLSRTTMSVCEGSTIGTPFLRIYATGGVSAWSTSSPSVATLNRVSGSGLTGISVFYSSDTVDVVGVSPGTSTITYSNSVCGNKIATVTVNPVPAAISGSPRLCGVGSITTLSTTSTGGTWSSANFSTGVGTSIATVGATTGIVTGVTPGSDSLKSDIRYTFASGCYASKIVTVYRTSAIIGTTTICEGTTSSLDNGVTGGTWSSSATSIATMGTSSGIMSGVAGGTATITYTNPVGCETYKSATVIPIPVVPAILGDTAVCTGTTITLSNLWPGGSWSSGSTSIASVNASTGVVRGISEGVATIQYLATNPCGSDFKTINIYVRTLHAISGPSVVCAGSTMTLSNTNPGGTWASSNLSRATVNSTSGLVTGVSAGTVTLSYTSFCGTVTKAVTVNPIPTTISGTTSICIGTSRTLSSTPSGGTWTTANALVASVGSTSGLVSTVNVGVTLITYTLGTGCLNSTTVTVLPTVSAGTISGATSVCVADTIRLSSSGASGGNWLSSNSSRATVSGGVVTGVSGGSVVIMYEAINSCGTDTAFYNVTINPLPNAGTLTGPSAVCVASTITLTSASTGGTWSISNSAGSVTGGIVTGVSAGTTTVTYSVNNVCGSDFAVKTLTINPLPSAGTISGSTSVCVGSTITLSSSRAGGTWRSRSVATATVSGGVVAGVSGGTATIVYTYTDAVFGCGSDSTTYNITVNPLPNAGTISGSDSVCVGSVIVLTTSGTTGGTWSSANTSIASVASGVVRGVATGTTLISYTHTNVCGTVVASKSVVVNPLPNAGTIAGANNVCVGASITLSNTTVSGGTWSSSNANATVSTGGVVTGVVGGTSTISYSYTNTCGTAHATYVVTLNPLPNPGTITGASSVCVNSTITLSNSISGGTWSSTGSAATISAGGVVYGVVAGTATISYARTNSCGTSYATSTITVNPLPDAGAITGASSVCVSSSITLTNAVSGGTWSRTGSAASVFVGIVSGVSAGTSTISYTYTNVCGTAIATKTITVNPLPNAGGISGPGLVCVAATATLTPTVAGGTWSTASVTATISTVGVVTGVSAGTAEFTYTITNVCGSASTTFDLTVNPLPNAGSLTGSSALCVGSSSTITTSGVAGGTWSSSSASATVSASGVVFGVSAGTTTISYSHTNFCGTNVAVHNMTINLTPTLISGPTSACAGLTTTLSNATSGGVWSCTNSAVATIGSTGVVYNIAGGTTLISYTLGTGCAASITFTVHPVAAVVGVNTLCVDATVTMSNAVAGGLWSSSNTSIATIGSTTGEAGGVATGSATLTYTTGFGCVSTKNVTVIPSSVALITGATQVCRGLAITLSNLTAGGTWTSSDSTVASVTSSTGIVSGRADGPAAIIYVVANSCGITLRYQNITVLSLSPIGGVAHVCEGSATTLSQVTSGGAWSSGNLSIATIGTGDGIVSGILAGTSAITYSHPVCPSVFKTVTVNPTPGTIAGVPYMCNGFATTLSNPVSGGTWTSSNTPVATVNSSTGVVRSVSAGNTTITYTLGGGCYATQDVTVHPLAAISGPSFVCTGATITMLNAVSGGAWSSSDLATATIGPTGIVTGVAAGTVTFSYTMGTGCMATMTTTVIAPPTAASLSGADMVCVNSTITLSASTTGGTWNSSNSGVATVGLSSGIAGGVSAGNISISYTLTNVCGAATATKALTVNPLPNAGTIAGAGSVCVGVQTTLTNAITGGTWSTPSSTASIATTGVVTGLSAGSATISYQITNICGTATTTKTMVVNPQPFAGVISGASSVCVGVTTSLTSTVSGGTWSSSDVALASVNTTTGVVRGVSAGTAAITYTHTNVCGSHDTSFVITINPQPVAGTITGASSVCEGVTTTLTNAISGGVWTSSTGAVATVSGGVVGGVSAGTVTISYSVTNMCNTAHATKALTVNPQPTSGTIIGSSTVCAGVTTTLSNARTGGVWTSGSTSIATVTSSTGIVGGVTAGTAEITYTYTNVCGSAATNITMTVNPQPVAGTISGLSSVCPGTTITLSSSASGGVWTSSSAAATVSGGVVGGVSTGSATISYSVTNVCNTAVATKTIAINLLPNAGSISGASSVCQSSTLTLTNAVAGGSWSTTGSVATVSSTGVVVGLAGGTATISYAVTNVCGTATVTKTILVSPLPNPGTILGDSIICLGMTTTMSNAASGGAWSSSSSAVTISGPIISGVALGVATISYGITNGCGTAYATKFLAVMNVLDAGELSGPNTVCVGSSITLADTVTMGTGARTWSTSNPSAIVTGGLVSGVSPGVDTVIFTISNYCGTSAAIKSMTVVTSPSAGSVSGPSVVCQGTSVTLSASVSGGTWSSPSATVSVGSASGGVTGVSAGTATISYSYTNICGISAATHTMTVSPAALAGVISGPSSVCQALTMTLSTGVSGGTWSSSNTGIANVNSSGVVSGVSAGTAVLSYVISNSCGMDTSTTVITVNAAPNAGSISGVSSVCAASSITLSNAVSGGTWSSSSSNATVSSGGIVTGVTAGPTVITYSVTNGCGLAFVIKAMTINPLPVAGTIVGASSVCESGTITLTNAASGGVWSSSNANATVSGGIVTGLAGGTATISYTVTNVCGTVDATHALVINPLPVAGTLSSIDSVYTFDSITVTPSVSGGSWSTSNASATVTSGGIVYGVLAGNVTISYTLTNSCGSSFATKTINVIGSIGPINGDTVLCEGATVTLTNAVPGGAWTSSHPLKASIGTSNGVLVGNSAGTSTITYTTGGTYVTARVTVLATPATINGVAGVCLGSTITLTTTSTGGTWSSTNTGVATISGGAITTVAPGTSTISYTNSAGCASERTVTVYGTPGSISGTGILCLGQSLTLTNPVPGGTWSSSHFTMASVGSTSGIVTAAVSAALAGSPTISYTMPGGCIATTVIPVVNLSSIIGGTSVVCSGLTTTFSNTTVGGVWSSDDLAVATVGSSMGVIFAVANGTSTISYTINPGCSTSKAVTVNTSPATISGSTSVCIGQTVTMSNTVSGGTWASSLTARATVGSSSGIVTGVTAGTFTLTYTIGSCNTTTEITVNPLPGVINGLTAMCAGNTVSLSNGTGGGTWVSSNTSVATVSGTGLVSGVFGGTSTISYSLGSGCAAVKIVTVSTAPSSISGQTAMCLGSTATFSNAVTGGAWTWTGASIASMGSATGIAAASGGTAGVSTITYTMPGGCNTTRTVSVVSLVAGVSGTGVICEGQTTTYTHPAVGGVWSSVSTAVATINPSTGVINGISAGSSVISYTISSACFKVTNVNVRVAPTAITGNLSICQASTSSLSNAVSGGAWASSSGSIPVGAGTGVVSGNAVGTATISYTIASSGCRSIATVTVTAQPGTINGVKSLCSFATTSLSNTVAGGAWTSSNTSVATVGTGAGLVYGVSGGTSVISYRMASGCNSITTVTVNPGPAPISGASAVCQGFTITMSNTVSGGVWSSASTSVATVGSATGIVSGAGGGTAKILYIMPGGCRDSVNVTVSTLSVISGPSSVCEGQTILLGNTAVGGSWSSSTTSVATVGTSSGLVMGVATGSSTISYSIGGGCVVTKSISVTGFAQITGPTSVCMGQTITLSNPIPGGSWSSYYTILATVDATTGVVTGVGGSGTFNTITYTLPGGCSDTARLTVNYLAPITGTGVVCEGSTVNLSNMYPGGTWSGSSSSIATITPTTAVVTGVGAGSMTVTYIMPTGCTTTYGMSVNPLPAAITGAPAVCVGATTTLSSTTSGGTWSIYFTTATIGSATGVVTGVSSSASANIVTYTLPTGCRDTARIMINSCPRGTDYDAADITNANDVSMSVVPNPSSGTFTIKGSLGTADDVAVDIEIANMLGQTVYKSAVVAKEGRMDEIVHLTNSVANGMYLLTVRSGDITRVFHIVIEQ